MDARPVFVFGSNLAGKHGKGAALYAKHYFGAVHGIGEGPTGHAYAIPTKDTNLKTRDWSEVETSIIRFLQYAVENPMQSFQLTPIGCGLAGFDKRQVWACLKTHGVPKNVYLTASWVND